MWEKEKLKSIFLNMLVIEKSIFINGTRADLPDSIYSDNSPGFSGDVSINVLGTNRNITSPIWTIHGNEAFPATVLSINISGWYSV